MLRSPLVSVLLIIGVIAGGTRVYQLSKQVSDLTSENQDLEARNENLQNALVQAHAKEETVVQGQQWSVAQIEGKIAAEKELLASAERRLQKVRNEGTGGQQLGDLSDKLKEQDQVVTDLSQQLKDIRAHRAELRNQDKFYQQQAGANQKQNDQDLKAQITQQQQELQQLTTQLKHFKVNPWDSDSTDQYNALQAQVQAQKNSLQQLKDQRAQSGAQWGYQKAQSHEQNQQNLGSLKNSEQDLQAQLQREKDAQASLQKDIQSGVQTRKSQSALIESAQADYDTQKAKLQDLENQLRLAQQRLQQIGGSNGAGGGK